MLNVIWRSKSKAWVTCDLFTDCMNEVFALSVKNNLLHMNLPLRALLVIDNAPAQYKSLEDDFFEEFKVIKIQFLPPNTAAHGPAGYLKF